MARLQRWYWSSVTAAPSMGEARVVVGMRETVMRRRASGRARRFDVNILFFEGVGIMY